MLKLKGVTNSFSQHILSIKHEINVKKSDRYQVFNRGRNGESGEVSSAMAANTLTLISNVA